MSGDITRRRLLRGAAGGVAGVTLLNTAEGSLAQTGSNASITFTSQGTGGASLTIDNIQCDVPAKLRVLNEESTTIAGPIAFESGTDVNDYTAELDSPLTESQTLSASLYNENGRGIAQIGRAHV